MKTLKEIFEASILGDIEDTIQHGDKIVNMDFETLLTAKSIEQFDKYATYMKNNIEYYGVGPFNYKQLKKGKPYIYIWKDSWSDDNSYAVSFVDKYPIQDKNTDYIDDAFYTICWVSNRQFTGVKCNYDDTGNRFTDLLEQDFGNDTMEGAYEIPNEYLKDIKNIMKNADKW